MGFGLVASSWESGIRRRKGRRGGRHTDDPARVEHRPIRRQLGRLPRGLEQRGELLRERKHALQVQREQLGPGLVRVAVVGLAPGGARVVDEHVQLGLARRELLGEALAFRERGEVRGQRDGRVRAHAGQRVELGAGGCAGFGVARGDVDLGAVDHEGFRDHAADAFGAARDEDDFVLAVLVGFG